MSMYLPPIGGMLGGVLGPLVAAEVGIAGEVGLAVVAVGAMFGLAAWLYSPLPSTNGGFGGPPARKQQWGWTSEPAKQYDEPTERDYMSANLIGVNWARESPEGDDGE